jgi:hypothetical protein
MIGSQFPIVDPHVSYDIRLIGQLSHADGRFFGKAFFLRIERLAGLRSYVRPYWRGACALRF